MKFFSSYKYDFSEKLDDRPELDYGYIEQMANALSAKYEDIEVEIGQDWSSNVREKKLIYNPLTFLTSTKADVISSIVHELGHIEYSTDPRDWKQSKFFKDNRPYTLETVNMFEDFRLDKIIEKDFKDTRGEENYEDIIERSHKAKVKVIAENWQTYSAFLRELVADELVYRIKNVRSSPDKKESIFREFNIRIEDTPEKIRAFIKKVEKASKEVKNKETLHDYYAGMIFEKENIPYKKVGTLKKRVKNTKQAITQSIEAQDTQEVVAINEQSVFPHIKDLFADYRSHSSFAGIMSPSYARAITGNLMNGARANTINETEKDPTDPLKKAMRSGSTHTSTPKAWLEGDYNSLRNSVHTPIAELKRKLLTVKRVEQSPVWEDRHTRGKLKVKGLYQQKIGERKLFSQKQERRQILSEFAYSIVIDNSGSMKGDPLVHTTRGVIVLAEVFEALEIPFEVLTFSDATTVIKKFEESLTKKIKGRIGGIIKSGGGNSNLYSTFKVTSIEKLSQKTKNVIILSDGDVLGVWSRNDYQTQFKDWQKKGITTIGIGIRCGDRVKNLTLNNGEGIDDSSQLPKIFIKLLKTALAKKGRKI